MTRTSSLFAAAALTFAPLLLSAQIEKGDSQISLSGSLSTQVGGAGAGSGTTGNIGGQYGYYLTRQFAMRGVAFLTATGGSGSGPSFTGLYGGGLELNLGTAGQKFVPYVAFDVLTSSTAQSEDAGGSGQGAFTLGPSVGARTFVSRSTAFSVALQYQTSSDNYETGTLATTFGFSVFFGSDRRR